MKIFIYTFRQGLVTVTIFDTADLSIQHLLQTYKRITYTEKWLAFIWQKKPKMLTVRSSILSHLLKYSVNLVKQKNLKRKKRKKEKKRNYFIFNQLQQIKNKSITFNFHFFFASSGIFQIIDQVNLFEKSF